MMRFVRFTMLCFLVLFAFAQEDRNILLENFELQFFSFSEGRGDKGGIGRFERVKEPVYEGKYSGKFSYDFRGTGEQVGYIYAPINCRIPLPGRPTALSFYLYGDGSHHTFTYRFVDSTGEVFQGSIGAIDWKGWRKVSLPLTEASTFSWGGNGDHKIDYPISLTQLILDKNSNDLPLYGAVYLDEITLQTKDISPTDALQVDLRCDKEQAIFQPGERERVKVVVLNGGDEEQKLSVDLKATDFFRRPIYAQEISLTLPARSVKESIIEFPLQEYGAYIVEAQSKEKKWEKTMVLSVLPPFRKGKLDILSPFGINGHIPNERELRMMEWAGIRWCRMDYLWEIIEPEKGKFSWSLFDQVFDNAKKHAVYPLPILCYNSPWGSRRSSNERGVVPDLENWLPYVRESVKRYGKFVKYWEVWNEPNIGFWTGTLEEYAELLKATYKAIKEVDKTAQVVMGGTAGTDLRFIEELYKRQVPFDIVNIHPYGYPQPPENYLEGAINACRELMRKYGDARKPIWITEFGWPNHIGPSGVDIFTQANYIVRAYIIALGAGVEKIFWYDYQNGPDPYYNEHNFGIVYMGDIPKPCYHALATMTRLLEGKRFVKKLEMPPDCYAYLFQGRGGEVVVMWAMKETTVPFKWESKGEIVDLMGNKKKIPSAKGIIQLTLGPSPIFLTSSKANAPEVAFLWEKGFLEIKPYEEKTNALKIRLPARSNLLVSFKVPSGITVKPGKWSATVQKGESRKTFTFEAKSIPYGEYNIGAVVEMAGRKYPISFRVRVRAPYQVEIQPSPLEKALKVRVKNLYDTKRGEGLVAHLESPQGLLQYLVGYFPLLKPKEEAEVKIPLMVDLSQVPQAYPFKVLLEDKQGVKVSYERLVSFWGIPKARGGNPLDPNYPQWEEVTGIELGEKERYVQITEPWKGPQDLWAEVEFLWDDINLYVKATVVDDVFYNDYYPGEVWQGDSLQFAIAPLDKHTKEEPFVQIDLAKARGEDIVYRRAWGMNLSEALLKVEGGIKVEGNRITYLFAIPWEKLGIKPEVGKTFGFSLLVNDNDGKGRKGWMEWGSGIGKEKDPSQFWDVTLLP